MSDHPVQDAIEAAIGEHAADLAEFDNAVVGDWCIVLSIQSLTSDENRLLRISREGMLAHQHIGLLHEAMYGFDD